jgi:molybdopterin-guanine dinucleotide biosynthesis protein MobB
LNRTAIAVVGRKKSGKTSTIEVLVAELTKRGYRIGVVKHIPEPNFTIDKEGKDTWRFAKAGAKTIVSVAADEIATIEKASLKNLSLDDVLQRCRTADIVFLEGFRSLVARNTDVQKIVVVKSSEEVLQAVRTFDPILAFVGPFSTERTISEVPYVNALKKPKKIAELVENVAKKKVAT